MISATCMWRDCPASRHIVAEIPPQLRRLLPPPWGRVSTLCVEVTCGHTRPLRGGVIGGAARNVAAYILLAPGANKICRRHIPISAKCGRFAAHLGRNLAALGPPSGRPSRLRRYGRPQVDPPSCGFVAWRRQQLVVCFATTSCLAAMLPHVGGATLVAPSPGAAILP